MELRWMTTADAALVVAARPLFDDQPRWEWAQRFLDDPNHHLCIAYVDDTPVGFISGVEMTHPDKGTEMFLYELGVDEPYRERGIGRALVDALAGLARSNGCYGMWVLTDHDNEAALHTYRSGGASEESTHVMLGWQWS